MMPIKTGYEDINVKLLPSKCSLLFIGQSFHRNFDDQINAAKNVMKNLSDVATAMIIVADNPLTPGHSSCCQSCNHYAKTLSPGPLQMPHVKQVHCHLME